MRLPLPLVLVLVLVLDACKSRPREVEPPLPIIETSTSSAWTLTRGGTDPAFRSGSTWLFITPAASHTDHRIPGITLGDERGPRFGLIGGYYAPHLALPESDQIYTVAIDSTRDALRIRFGDALEVRARAPTRDRLELTTRGSAVVFAPADRAELRATLSGKPAAAFALTAGEPAGLQVLHADALQVETKRTGAITIASSCAALRVIRPVQRGATSVFAVGIGPAPARVDPLYGVENANDAQRCAETTTSTLTFPTAAANANP